MLSLCINTKFVINVYDVTIDVTTDWNGSLGGYTGYLDLSTQDWWNSNEILIPRYCFQTTDGGRLGTASIIGNQLRVNAGLSATFRVSIVGILIN